MQIDRRQFLTGTAALSTAVTVTPGLSALSATKPATSGSWGYTNRHTDVWSTGFATRQEALAELRKIYEHGETGWCEQIPLSIPNFCEDIAEWLCGYPENAPLGNLLVERLSADNDEGDFEGEFTDTMWRTERKSLGDEARTWVAASLLRHGHADIARTIEADEFPDKLGIADDDPLFEAIRHDKLLAEQLTEAATRWIFRYKLDSDLKGLTLSKRATHVMEPMSLSID